MALMPHPAEKLQTAEEARASLHSRVQYFLTSRYRDREYVRDFVERLQQFGQLAIIGGMLRDLALLGNRNFKSDVDFVCDPTNYDAAREFLIEAGAVKNSFGGFRFPGGSWKIDIWLLPDTWAAREGHREVTQLRDLLDTTFFDWDAILYDTQQDALVCRDDYFDRITTRLLDVNLEPNPNVLGSVLRSLRLVVRHQASIGTRLANYLAREIRGFDDQTLLSTERRAFPVWHLSADFLTLVRNRLHEVTALERACPISLFRKQQLDLFWSEDLRNGASYSKRGAARNETSSAPTDLKF